jgi:dimethylglycine dehydrogenase
MRWFLQHLPMSGVTLRNISNTCIGFQIAGPRAQDLLASVVLADVSTAALPFMAVTELDIGLCRAQVQRISFSGELGYEIYVNRDNQISLYEELTRAGKAFGLKPFGMRAMMSLRLEKSFGAWMREFKPDYMPVETGLDRFVSYDKSTDFIGKAAVVKEKMEGASRKLCTFVVDAADADVHGDEPIWVGEEVVGFVTSGGYAHYSGLSVAIGFLPVALITQDREVEIEILGERRKARMITEPLFDPKGERIRA